MLQIIENRGCQKRYGYYRPVGSIDVAYYYMQNSFLTIHDPSGSSQYFQCYLLMLLEVPLHTRVKWP